MSWQNAVINRYKEVYPKDSIRDIARRTGIHYSRAGRLLNGADMKLKEFQAFNKAVSKDGPAIDYAVKLFDECLIKLSAKKINSIISSLENNIIHYQIANKSLVEQFKYIEQRG